MKIPNKVQLAFLPTPLQKINFENENFLMKRDDMSGFELTGNKVRKLEYLIYQAKKEKADMVFTCGGEQSNHARATAIAAARSGIRSKLFLWGGDSKTADGNLFFDKLIGADISFLNKRNYSEVNEIMYEERDALIKRGKKVFVIPEGGSTTLGIWGYLDVVHELKKQIDLKKINGICLAAGSGGTAAGLLVGIAKLKLNLKVYAVNVLYPKEEIHNKIMNLAEGCVLDYKLKCRINEKNLVILDGYSKEGYKNITDKKLRLIKRFAQYSGIILDPAYTGKSFTAFYENFLFSKKKVFFLHTGGLYGVFGKRGKYLKA